MSAEGCLSFLNDAGITALRDEKQIIDGQPRVYKEASFGLPRRQNDPPLRLFREFITSYLKEHPSTNEEVPTTLARSVNNGRCIYTPLYESWLQPIEMVWAQVKHEVRMGSTNKRTGKQLQQQTRDALRAMNSSAFRQSSSACIATSMSGCRLHQPAVFRNGRPSIGCGAQVQTSVKLHSAAPGECRSSEAVAAAAASASSVHRRGGGRTGRSRKRAKGGWRGLRRLNLSMTYLGTE